MVWYGLMVAVTVLSVRGQWGWRLCCALGWPAYWLLRLAQLVDEWEERQSRGEVVPRASAQAEALED